MTDVALITALKDKIAEKLTEDIDKEIDRHVEAISLKLKEQAHNRIVSAVESLKINCGCETNKIVLEVHLDE